MSQVEAAVAAFQDGCSCSQAILAAFCEPLGMDREAALRVAAGFGGGMGRLGETCGAVSGAVMVLGLKHGTPAPQDRSAKERTYEQVRRFVKQFLARNGSIRCQELLDCDISTPEGFQSAKDRKLLTTICPRLVRDAAEILEGLL
jgi:C_GCAxxG_C_C family probable redox protein